MTGTNDMETTGISPVRVIRAVAILEMKRNWKVLVGALAMVYGIKALAYLLYKSEPGDMAALGLMIFSLGGIFMATFFAGTSISSEKTGMTLEFLFTRAIPRRWVMTGKLIGSSVLLATFLLAGCLAATPAIFAAPSWAPIVYASLRPLVGGAIAVVALLGASGFYLSTLCSGATATVIFAHVVAFAICAGTGILLNLEGFTISVWILTATLTLGAIRGISRGDILQVRRIFARSVPVLAWGAVAAVCAMFLLSFWRDANHTPGGGDHVDGFLKRSFAGKLVTNRSRYNGLPYDISGHSASIMCLDLSQFEKGGSKPVSSTGDAAVASQWSRIGSRHWTAISVSPDGGTLLVGSFRDIYGLKSMNPRLFLISSDGNTRDLGVFPMFNNSEACWDGLGRLLLLRAPDRRWGMRKNHLFEILRIVKGEIETLGTFDGAAPWVLPMGEGVLIRENGWGRKGWLSFKAGSTTSEIPEALKNFELEDIDAPGGAMLISYGGVYWHADLATLELTALDNINARATSKVWGSKVFSVWRSKKEDAELKWLRQGGPDPQTGGSIKMDGHVIGSPKFSSDGRFVAVITEDEEELEKWGKTMEMAIEKMGGSSAVPNFARGIIHEKALKGFETNWKIHVLDLDKGCEISMLGPWKYGPGGYHIQTAFLDGRSIAVATGGKVEILQF